MIIRGLVSVRASLGPDRRCGREDCPCALHSALEPQGGAAGAVQSRTSFLRIASEREVLKPDQVVSDGLSEVERITYRHG